MAATTPSSGARASERPLSPHLQIYRWPVTMATSILHRASGLANAAGLILITFWLVAAAMGPDAFGIARDFLSSILGRLILFGFTLSWTYHGLNGVRHLFWDAGTGFSLKVARASGIAVFILTIILTLIIWLGAYWFAGAANT